MAALDALRPTRNAPYRMTFPMRDTSGALKPGAAGLSAFVSQDSGAYGATAAAPVEIGSSGIYTLDLTEAEMTVAASVSVRVTSSDANAHFAEVPFEPSAESGVAQSGSGSAITLRSGASGSDDLFNGSQVEIVRGTGAGQVRTGIDYNGTTKVLTVDRAWQQNPDTTSVYRISGIGIQHGTDIVAKVNASQIAANSAAATALAFLYKGGTIDSSVNDSSPSSSSWVAASGLSATDDFYNASILIFVSGTLAGLARQITDYDGGTGTITTVAFPTAPANGDEFVILGRVF